MARIYVACLASYNNGVLHGAWVDLDGKDAEDVKGDIALMLKASPYPNVTLVPFTCEEGHELSAVTMPADLSDVGPCWCGAKQVQGESYLSAEEYAVHDSEGFGNWTMGEYPDLDDVVAMAAMVEEHGEWVSELLDHANDLQDAKRMLDEAYQGEHDSLAGWAEDFADETGLLDSIPENLRCYFDFERYARDAEIDGDVFTVRDGGSLHVFWGNA